MASLMASLLQLRRIRQAHSTLRSTSSEQGPLLSLSSSDLPLPRHRHEPQTSPISTSTTSLSDSQPRMSDTGSMYQIAHLICLQH